jgi:hypothetical protein
LSRQFVAGCPAVSLGSHNTLQANGAVYDAQGNYLSASGLTSDQGIENPQPTTSALHDKTRQGSTFGNLSYYHDDTTRLDLMFGTYDGKFQIPNNPGQTPAFSLAGFSDLDTGFNPRPSAFLGENQKESTRFLALSYQKTEDPRRAGLPGVGAAPVLERAFHPRIPGDLIYNGVASGTPPDGTARRR